MQNIIPLDPNATINEIVACHPETIPVFNCFGMDTCCGGGVSVDEATRRDGLDLDAVLTALRAAVARR